VARGQKKRVFPLKTGKKRQKGKKKPTVGFRAPDDVAEWLKKMDADQVDKTEAMVTAVRLLRDVYERMNERWYEIEYRAKRKGLQPGAMLAELALSAIEAEEAAAAKPAKK
jgi:hypothetical protein